MSVPPPESTCQSCRQVLLGTYCHHCGEKVFRPHDKRLGHLLHESFHFLTHFEGSFFLTLKTVFLRPGKLSLDYCAGIRKKYFKPIPFFLFSVILYLLFSTFKGLNMSFWTYIDKGNVYPSLVAKPAARKAKALGITTWSEMADRYDAKSPKVAKVMLLLLIPLSALVLYGLHFKKRPYFFDHYIFAAESVAFFVLTQFVLLYFVKVLVAALYSPGRDWFLDSSWVWVAVRLLYVVFVFVGSLRFYGGRWPAALWKTVVFCLIFYAPITTIYNIVLFFTVLLLL